VAAAPDQRAGPEDLPRHRHRQVVLPQVQHVRARRQGHVRPVVHREQPPVPPARFGEHLQQREFLPRLQALLPQLDDVHPARQRRVEKLAQVALPTPPVGAQVQPRRR
jgi:hypothetical protein